MGQSGFHSCRMQYLKCTLRLLQSWWRGKASLWGQQRQNKVTRQRAINREFCWYSRTIFSPLTLLASSSNKLPPAVWPDAGSFVRARPQHHFSLMFLLSVKNHSYLAKLSKTHTTAPRWPVCKCVWRLYSTLTGSFWRATPLVLVLCLARERVMAPRKISCLLTAKGFCC